MVGKALRTSAGVTPHDPVTWAFYGLGLAATLVVTAITTRIARRTWREYYAERTPAAESRHSDYQQGRSAGRSEFRSFPLEGDAKIEEIR